MPEILDDYAKGMESPAGNAAAVTPSDTTELANVTRAFFIGVGGDLTITMISGQTVTFQNCQTGSILALRATHVKATLTTATAIVALW